MIDDMRKSSNSAIRFQKSGYNIIRDFFYIDTDIDERTINVIDFRLHHVFLFSDKTLARFYFDNGCVRWHTYVRIRTYAHRHEHNNFSGQLKLVFDGIRKNIERNLTQCNTTVDHRRVTDGAHVSAASSSFGLQESRAQKTSRDTTNTSRGDRSRISKLQCPISIRMSVVEYFTVTLFWFIFCFFLFL